MTCYFVYIVASKSRIIYVGLTNDLRRRVFQHRQGWYDGFTKKYRVNRLVYFESTTDRKRAEYRERHLKGWTRERKLALIEQANPFWTDLAEEWFTNPKSWLL